MRRRLANRSRLARDIASPSKLASIVGFVASSAIISSLETPSLSRDGFGGALHSA